MAISPGTGLRTAWIQGLGHAVVGVRTADGARSPCRASHNEKTAAPGTGVAAGCPKEKPTPDRFAADVGRLGIERLDRGADNGCGSAQTAQADDDAHPMDISRFRPYAVVQIANALA